VTKRFNGTSNYGLGALSARDIVEIGQRPSARRDNLLGHLGGGQRRRAAPALHVHEPNIVHQAKGAAARQKQRMGWADPAAPLP
jgi:hypothetical protein